MIKELKIQSYKNFYFVVTYEYETDQTLLEQYAKIVDFSAATKQCSICVSLHV